MGPYQRCKPLKITCRCFQPENSDITAKFVRGSVPGQAIDVPTYASIDPLRLQVESEGLIRHQGYLFPHKLGAAGSSEIVQLTFHEAFQYAVSCLSTSLFKLTRDDF